MHWFCTVFTNPGSMFYVNHLVVMVPCLKILALSIFFWLMMLYSRKFCTAQTKCTGFHLRRAACNDSLYQGYVLTSDWTVQAALGGRGGWLDLRMPKAEKVSKILPCTSEWSRILHWGGNDTSCIKGSAKLHWIKRFLNGVHQSQSPDLGLSHSTR